MPITYEDLFAILPVSTMDDSRFGTNAGYIKWEREVAQPFIEKHPDVKEFISWCDGERDSFGPLTRVAVVRMSDDAIIHFVYG